MTTDQDRFLLLIEREEKMMAERIDALFANGPYADLQGEFRKLVSLVYRNGFHDGVKAVTEQFKK